MGRKRPTTEERIAGASPSHKWAEEPLPEKVTSLRQKLYQKAKREPKFRFYALYDRVYRLDILRAAYRRVRANRGSPGVDGLSFDQIEEAEDGPEQFVLELHEALKRKEYVPSPVLRKYIPKPDGRLRPLGIPTIRDRVAQMAVKLVIEPIFEADFEDCSYGFRIGRSAHDALDEVKRHAQAGLRAVYDADLEKYFDTIPHDRLMKAIQMRITDGSVLKLIRMWLQAPIVETDDHGKKTVNRSKRGSPQGGVISPLLSNIYLHWFDHFFHAEDGPSRWAAARLVRFADDFVVMARYVGPRLRMWIEQTLEDRMGLSINREKTAIVDLRQQGSLNFLGFTFQYRVDKYGRGHHYLHVGPSKRVLSRMREHIREKTSSCYCFLAIPNMIREINTYLVGWANYFDYSNPSEAFRHTNWFVRESLTKHLKRRSQRPFRPPKGKSFYRTLADLGLVYLQSKRRATPRACLR